TFSFFFFQAEDGIRVFHVTGVQTCALPISSDAGVRSLLIMCDGIGALGDPDDAGRSAAVEGHKPWVVAAKELGCHSIRVNAASRSEERRVGTECRSRRAR